MAFLHSHILSLASSAFFSSLFPLSLKYEEPTKNLHLCYLFTSYVLGFIETEFSWNQQHYYISMGYASRSSIDIVVRYKSPRKYQIIYFWFVLLFASRKLWLLLFRVKWKTGKNGVSFFGSMRYLRPEVMMMKMLLFPFSPLAWLELMILTVIIVYLTWYCMHGSDTLNGSQFAKEEKKPCASCGLLSKYRLLVFYQMWLF